MFWISLNSFLQTGLKGLPSETSNQHLLDWHWSEFSTLPKWLSILFFNFYLCKSSGTIGNFAQNPTQMISTTDLTYHLRAVILRTAHI